MSNLANGHKLAIFSRAVGGLMLLALAASCDSPHQPSQQRLEIVGTIAVAPEQTTEVKAFLVTLTGARQDVTARVTWTSSNVAVLSVSSDGRVTGGAVGEATVRAILDDLSASAPVIVVPPGTFRLAGVVRASGSTTTLSGAVVQLITESGEVLSAVTAFPVGFRFYGVAGRARLRISRSGFHPYEAEIDIHDHLVHDVSLSALDLSGTYTLTISASSRCPLDLPEAMRVRTYKATIAHAGGAVVVTLPSIFPPWANRSFGVDNRFIGVFGVDNVVTFQFQFEEWFLEGLVTDFSAYGTATATISSSGLSGTWDGYVRGLVDNDDGRANHVVMCTASDHGLTFSR